MDNKVENDCLKEYPTRMPSLIVIRCMIFSRLLNLTVWTWFVYTKACNQFVCWALIRIDDKRSLPSKWPVEGQERHVGYTGFTLDKCFLEKDVTDKFSLCYSSSSGKCLNSQNIFNSEYYCLDLWGRENKLQPIWKSHLTRSPLTFSFTFNSRELFKFFSPRGICSQIKEEKTKHGTFIKMNSIFSWSFLPLHLTQF